MKTAFPQANIQASYAMGCAPVFSGKAAYSPFFPTCPEFNQIRLQTALEAPAEDVIFLAQNLLDWRLQGILETVKRLRDAGKTVYLLGDFQLAEQYTPIEIEIETLRFPGRTDRLQHFFLENPFPLDGDFADQIRALGAVYISYKPLFYDGKYHFTDRASGKLLTSDGMHLNSFGARKFGGYLRKHYPLP